MPKLVTNSNVVVVRDGKRVKPTIGKIFNYTADEVKTIIGMVPLGLRKPVNETEDGSLDGSLPKPGSQKTIVEEDDDTAVDSEDDEDAVDEDIDETDTASEDDDEDADEAAPTPKAKAKGKKGKAKAKSEDDDI